MTSIDQRRPRQAGLAPLDVVVSSRAAENPTRLAVAAPDRSLTYRELEIAAALVAAKIRDRVELRREAIVAVVADRSADFLPAVFGCWQAGAAFMPIDPDLPDRRIAFMLEDAGAVAVVGGRASASRFQRFQRPVIAVDDADGGEARATSVSRLEELAYVIYTSGSTGAPKGVMIEHAQLANYVRGLTEELRLEAPTRWAALTSLAADLSFTALFPPLAVGGCVDIVPKAVALDAPALQAHFEANDVDSAKTTPSHMSMLLARSSRPLPRRRLILAGEILSSSLVARISHRAPTCEIYNSYGPAETTIAVCMHRCDASDDSHGEIVPVGRGFAGMRVHIMGDQGPVARGETGEVYIEGPGVSRGYLNRPELTSEVFVSRRQGPAERRMYRSGDRARLLAHGIIQIVGRDDDQVKVRGFRVEIGEVEAALDAQPLLRSAAVVARPLDDGGHELVAFVVADRRETFDVGTLRRSLGEILPEYMIPADVNVVAALPTTPSGKVDRVALTRLARRATGEASANGGAGGEELLDVVVSIYRDVLGDPGVAATDDFFANGGHSLLAVHAVQRISDAIGRPVPVATFFLHPTPSELAAALGAKATAPDLRVRSQ